MTTIGEIVDGLPTHDRKGNPVTATGSYAERFCARIYWWRFHRDFVPPEKAYECYLRNALPAWREELEGSLDPLLMALDHAGFEIVDREREE